VIVRWLLLLCLLSMPTAWASPGGEELPPDIARILNRGELIVALHEEDVVPFFMRDADGQLDGLDVALARDIAGNLGVAVRVVRDAATYDGLVDLVARGEADVAISLLSRTLQRALRVSFTRPYAELHQALLINRLRTARLRPQNDPAVALDRPGIRIGTIAGSAYMGFAAQGFPQAEVVGYPSWQQAVSDLLAGNLHALLYDEIEVLAWQQDNRSMSLYVKTVVLRERKDHIAMAVNWRDTQWLDWLNLYLETVSETGALERLTQRYQKGGLWRSRP